MKALKQLVVGEETELRTMDAGETLAFQMEDGNVWTLEDVYKRQGLKRLLRSLQSKTILVATSSP